MLKSTHLSNFQGGAIPGSAEWKALIDDAVPGTRSATELGLAIVCQGKATISTSLPFSPMFGELSLPTTFTSLETTSVSAINAGLNECNSAYLDAVQIAFTSLEPYYANMEDVSCTRVFNTSCSTARLFTSFSSASKGIFSSVSAVNASLGEFSLPSLPFAYATVGVNYAAVMGLTSAQETYPAADGRFIKNVRQPLVRHFSTLVSVSAVSFSLTDDQIALTDHWKIYWQMMKPFNKTEGYFQLHVNTSTPDTKIVQSLFNEASSVGGNCLYLAATSVYSHPVMDFTSVNLNEMCTYGEMEIRRSGLSNNIILLSGKFHDRDAKRVENYPQGVRVGEWSAVYTNCTTDTKFAGLTFTGGDGNSYKWAKLKAVALMDTSVS